jgi:hypothetical protein
MTTETAWSQPQPVSDLELAFGGQMSRLLPPPSEIPDEFHHGHTKWNKLQQTWFFRGLSGVTWSPKPGIDQAAAIRHLKAIQASWEPKHEHKEAAVAYLASLWFEDVTFEAAS